ncbi:hypothetical protein ACFPK1_24275 [Actinomycetospora rhizophila]|uniref:Uncharacterized protein n=1 Tax=Actinomycetospora rhizophila TaxID=1416876 RepID=A0ABV9ZMB3_9PSEU
MRAGTGGLRREARPGGAAHVARRRWRAPREVALTGHAVEIAARRTRLVIPWEQVTAVRPHGPDRADGRPRRIALDVDGPLPGGPLLDRLTAPRAGRPGERRTLVLRTAGLDADPALLLAALDHYLELPAERRRLAEHDWASRPTH